MARYEKGHKADTHKRVVEIAARRFRSDGIDGVGVASLMADAGLTHGGFYAHFASKEALVKEALIAALASSSVFARKAAGEAAPLDLRAYIGSYLSPAHRDASGDGLRAGGAGAGNRAAAACDAQRLRQDRAQPRRAHRFRAAGRRRARPKARCRLWLVCAADGRAAARAPRPRQGSVRRAFSPSAAPTPCGSPALTSRKPRRGAAGGSQKAIRVLGGDAVLNRAAAGLTPAADVVDHVV